MAEGEDHLHFPAASKNSQAFKRGMGAAEGLSLLLFTEDLLS